MKCVIFLQVAVRRTWSLHWTRSSWCPLNYSTTAKWCRGSCCSLPARQRALHWAAVHDIA